MITAIFEARWTERTYKGWSGFDQDTHIIPKVGVLTRTKSLWKFKLRDSNSLGFVDQDGWVMLDLESGVWFGRSNDIVQKLFNRLETQPATWEPFANMGQEEV